jgi:replicative DNA helicase
VPDIDERDVCSRPAEAGVIGSLILIAGEEPAKVGEVIGKLKADDFYFSEHRVLYPTLCEMYFKTGTIDSIVVCDQLKRSKELNEVGGVQDYLKRVLDTVPSSASLDYYVGIVREKAKNREIIETAETIRGIAFNGETVGQKIIEIQRCALNLSPLQANSGAYPVSELVQEAVEDLISNKSGLKIGFDKLDWHLGGLHGGDMVILAARPSMGKTSFALDGGLNMARAGKSIAIYSLEMTRRQLVQRMVCSIARVDSHKIRQHSYMAEDVNELATAAGILANYKLFIIDCSQLTPETFTASLTMIKQRFGLDCAIIDYLQLMQSQARSENRQQEITTISRGLKAAAKSNNIPVIVLSQLNREVEHRATHQPQLSDLRESGSIEQDADVVILLHRPDWYHRGEASYTPTHTGVFQVAKARNGPTGEVELLFNEQYVSFANVSEVTEP